MHIPTIAVLVKKGNAAPEGEKLDGGDEAGFRVGKAVRHAGSVESVTGVAVLVQEDDAAGALAAAGEKLNGGLGGAGGSGAGGAEEIGRGFGEDDFHNGLPKAGRGNGASLGVGVATGADERRITDATRKFATGPSGGGGGEEPALVVKGDGADSTLQVAAMMLGSVGVLAAAFPGFAFGRRDEFLGVAQGNALLVDKALGAGGDEHHVWTFFEDRARSLDGIFDAMETGDGTGTKRGAFHDDRVTLDVTIEIEVRAVASIEGGIVFEDGERSFDGVESVAAVGENGPSRMKSAETASLADFDGFVRDIPGTAMNDERRSHGVGG
jgi:hypothetical protein